MATWASRFRVLGVLLVSAAAPVHAQKATPKGSAGGAAKGADASAEVMATAKGHRLTLRSRTTLKSVGKINLPNTISDLKMVANFVVVITPDALVIVDVSDPAKPVIVGIFPFPAGSSATFAENQGTQAQPCPGDKGGPPTFPYPQQNAAIGVFNAGLSICNITNPSNMCEKGVASLPNNFQFPSICKGPPGIFFVANGSSGIQAVDASDSEDPTVVDDLAVNANVLEWADDAGLMIGTSAGFGFCAFNPTTKQFGSPPAIFPTSSAPGSMSYLGSGKVVAVAFPAGGLELYDLTDPTDPDLLTQCPVPGGASKALATDTDFFGIGSEGFGRAAPTGPPGLAVWEPLDPTTPAFDGVVVDGRLFVPTGTSPGLGVYEIPATPDDDPILLNAGVSSNVSPGKSIVPIGGERLLVAGTSGLDIVSISNPEAPIRIGRYPLSFSNSVVPLSDTSCLVLSYFGSSGFKIVNFANPASPSLVGSATLTGQAYDALVMDTTAIVAAGSGGIVLVDISNPASPVVGSTITPPAVGPAGGFALDIERDGDIVAVANSGNYVHFYEVSTNKAVGLSHAGYYPVVSNAVAIHGNVVCTGAATNMVVLNIADPANPVLLDTVKVPGSIEHIRIDGDTVIVGAHDGGVQLYTLAAPPPSDGLAVY